MKLKGFNAYPGKIMVKECKTIVNSAYQNFKMRIKSRHWGAILLVAAVMGFTVAVLVKKNPQEEFQEKRAALVVRDIGHHLLLQSGDSTSRVLPVKNSGAHIFSIAFENAFSFMPDSVVKTVQNSVALSGLAPDYRVSIFDCSTREMVYGFEIRSGSSDIEPCLGRVQPKGCYTIQIDFLNVSSAGTLSNRYLIFGFVLAGLGIFTLTGRRFRRPQTEFPQAGNETVRVGRYEFDEAKQALKDDGGIISLSNKESKVLGMLAARPNQLVDRDHLLKEVWENEGVITGRSLDMFVSKLRRKLGNDLTVRIVNVHGKGYKLEIV
jgi:hypothetical protein